MILLRAAARKAGRSVQVLAVTGAAPDHPVGLEALEGAYLKAVWLRVGDRVAPPVDGRRHEPRTTKRTWARSPRTWATDRADHRQTPRGGRGLSGRCTSRRPRAIQARPRHRRRAIRPRWPEAIRRQRPWIPRPSQANPTSRAGQLSPHLRARESRISQLNGRIPGLMDRRRTSATRASRRGRWPGQCGQQATGGSREFLARVRVDGAARHCTQAIATVQGPRKSP